MQPIVVTRHKALVAYLVETGVVAAPVQVVEHATPEDVRGRHVIGVLPLALAVEAHHVTEVPLLLGAADVWRKLSLEEIREWAQPPVSYVVRRYEPSVKHEER